MSVVHWLSGRSLEYTYCYIARTSVKGTRDSQTLNWLNCGLLGRRHTGNLDWVSALADLDFISCLPMSNSIIGSSQFLISDFLEAPCHRAQQVEQSDYCSISVTWESGPHCPWHWHTPTWPWTCLNSLIPTGLSACISAVVLSSTVSDLRALQDESASLMHFLFSLLIALPTSVKLVSGWGGRT